MDGQVLGLIALVRAALTGEAQALPADFDLEAAYDAINKHNIAVMALEGAVICGVDKKLPVMQKLFVQAFAAIRHVEEQDRYAAELFAAFEAAQVDFMPVKGALLRGLYPKREYRSMGDMDILIRVEQYDRVREVMLKLGYSAGQEDDHVYVWRKGALMLELHKYLIKAFYSHFGVGWDCAAKTSDHRFQMQEVEHYLFVFVHLADHYRTGGVGIRQLCDFWLLRRSIADLDEDYVRRELDKLELLEFYDNILDTMKVWFEGETAGEKTKYITNVIYHSGAFGRLEDKMLADGACMAGDEQANAGIRYRNVWKHMFLPLGNMQSKYPILRKYPVLLPFMWIYRGGYILFCESWKVKSLQKRFNTLKQENVNEYQQSLEYVGLRFRNK